MTIEVIEVVIDPTPVIEIVSRESYVIESVAMGPQGPRGLPGVSTRINQTAPSANWVLAHDLARVPLVGVYFPNGEEVEADVIATDQNVIVTFANAVTGFVVLI